MAFMDSAQLLAECKRLAKRPATDTGTTDPDWYALLTQAQIQEYNNFATHFPKVLYGGPVALTSVDGGITYNFPDDADGNPIVPLGNIELYEALDKKPLRHGAFWDRTADYVLEGSKIRMPQNKAKSFGSGPFARFITPPGVLDATTQPTLQPITARILLVYRACGLWARRGNLRDPKPFDDAWKLAWYGNHVTGDIGFLAALKTQDAFMGAEAIQAPSSFTGLEFINDGSNYTPFSP